MTMPDTQPLSDSSLVIAERWFQILTINKAALGLEDVWFGDQQMVPRTPTLCVEPGLKRRTLFAAQNRTENEIDTYFLIYHSPISEMQDARRETMRVAEAVEHFLHLNHLRLFAANGTTQLTVHGYCTDMDPGYSRKQNTTYNAVQMTWRNLTKTWLMQP